MISYIPARFPKCSARKKTKQKNKSFFPMRCRLFCPRVRKKRSLCAPRIFRHFYQKRRGFHFYTAPKKKVLCPFQAGWSRPRFVYLQYVRDMCLLRIWELRISGFEFFFGKVNICFHSYSKKHLCSARNTRLNPTRYWYAISTNRELQPTAVAYVLYICDSQKKTQKLTTQVDDRFRYT